MPSVIDLSMIVDQFVRGWPATNRVMIRHRMLCIGCPIGNFHTIADATAAFALSANAAPYAPVDIGVRQRPRTSSMRMIEAVAASQSSWRRTWDLTAFPDSPPKTRSATRSGAASAAATARNAAKGSALARPVCPNSAGIANSISDAPATLRSLLSSRAANNFLRWFSSRAVGPIGQGMQLC